MSFDFEPIRNPQTLRAGDHQERLREAATAREEVKEAFDVDYNNSGKPRSVIRRILARLHPGDRER